MQTGKNVALEPEVLEQADRLVRDYAYRRPGRDLEAMLAWVRWLQCRGRGREVHLRLAVVQHLLQHPLDVRGLGAGERHPEALPQHALWKSSCGGARLQAEGR